MRSDRPPLRIEIESPKGQKIRINEELEESKREFSELPTPVEDPSDSPELVLPINSFFHDTRLERLHAFVRFLAQPSNRSVSNFSDAANYRDKFLGQSKSDKLDIVRTIAEERKRELHGKSSKYAEKFRDWIEYDPKLAMYLDIDVPSAAWTNLNSANPKLEPKKDFKVKLEDKDTPDSVALKIQQMLNKYLIGQGSFSSKINPTKHAHSDEAQYINDLLVEKGLKAKQIENLLLCTLNRFEKDRANCNIISRNTKYNRDNTYYQILLTGLKLIKEYRYKHQPAHSLERCHTLALS